MNSQRRGGHKTTVNVLKSKERKRRNRELRKEEDQAEAKRLGISVAELNRRRVHEAEKIRRNPPTHLLGPREYRYW